jgi:hypothetical protein
MPKKPNADRKFTLDQIKAQVSGGDAVCKVTDAGTLFPPLNRCRGACPACDAIMKRYTDAADERDRLRAEFDAAQPVKAKPPVETAAKYARHDDDL